jgi:hypothetical protein
VRGWNTLPDTTVVLAATAALLPTTRTSTMATELIALGKSLYAFILLPMPVYIALTLYLRRGSRGISDIPLRRPSFFGEQNYLAMSNTADVTGSQKWYSKFTKWHRLHLYYISIDKYIYFTIKNKIFL